MTGSGARRRAGLRDPCALSRNGGCIGRRTISAAFSLDRPEKSKVDACANGGDMACASDDKYTFANERYRHRHADCFDSGG